MSKSIDEITRLTQKEQDEQFRRLLEMMKDAAQSRELFREPVKAPDDISGIVIVEDPVNIQIGRYFLTDGAKAIYHKIRTMNSVADELRKRKITVLNATMLYGESGTGKTQFCRYVAYDMGLPLVIVKLSTIISIYIGGTNHNLDKIFSFVRKIPCVFLIDEIDAIGAIRASGGESSRHDNKVVTCLIQLLDHMPNEVVTIAATNRLDIIDKAIMRRFRFMEEFKKLSGKEAMEMAKNYLADCGVDFDEHDIQLFAGLSWNPSIVETILVDSIAEYLVSGAKGKMRLYFSNRFNEEVKTDD